MSIYSSTARQHLDTIAQQAKNGRENLLTIKEKVHAAIRNRETDFGALLDLAIEINEIVDGTAEALSDIKATSEAAANIIGPANKNRPTPEEL